MNECCQKFVEVGWWHSCEVRKFRGTAKELDYKKFTILSVKIVPILAITFYLKPSILTIMGQCLRNFLWAWIFPACGPHVYHFHSVIGFHFQFGFGNQDGTFQFLQRVPGHWIPSSLLCTLHPRTRRHKPSLSIASPSEGPDLS